MNIQIVITATLTQRIPCYAPDNRIAHTPVLVSDIDLVRSSSQYQTIDLQQPTV